MKKTLIYKIAFFIFLTAFILFPFSTEIHGQENTQREFTRDEIRDIRNALVRLEKREECSSDAAFANFREVTSGSIAPGKLYRSSHPAWEWWARAPYAAGLAGRAGINTIINLSDNPDDFPRLGRDSSWYKRYIDRNHVFAAKMEFVFTAQDFKDKLKGALTYMINNGGPYLVHCVEGKDRTGMVIAILECLMSADPKDIVEGYMISYENLFGIEKGDYRYQAISQIMVRQLADINDGRPVTSARMAQQAAERYLRSLGFSNSQIGRIKSRLE